MTVRVILWRFSVRMPKLSLYQVRPIYFWRTETHARHAFFVVYMEFGMTLSLKTTKSTGTLYGVALTVAANPWYKKKKEKKKKRKRQHVTEEKKKTHTHRPHVLGDVFYIHDYQALFPLHYESTSVLIIHWLTASKHYEQLVTFGGRRAAGHKRELCVPLFFLSIFAAFF